MLYCILQFELGPKKGFSRHLSIGRVGNTTKRAKEHRSGHHHAEPDQELAHVEATLFSHPPASVVKDAFLKNRWDQMGYTIGTGEKKS